MKIGLILGGGGEVGIAWEIGVLAALEREAGFRASTSAVIAGTSAGAITGAYAAQGRSMNDLVALEGRGQGVAVGAGFGRSSKVELQKPITIPTAIIHALMSTEGTFEERGARLGTLALQSPVHLDPRFFIDGFRTMLGDDEWPDIDFRPTAVNGASGRTTLWDRHSGITFAAAVASSCSVPGVFPPVMLGGAPYIDVPRRPFAGDLIRSKSLDAVIFVGLILPILSNNNEQKSELEERAADGKLRTAIITGGPEISSVGSDLLDHSARVRAVEIGLADGQRAVEAVKALVSFCLETHLALYLQAFGAKLGL